MIVVFSTKEDKLRVKESELFSLPSGIELHAVVCLLDFTASNTTIEALMIVFAEPAQRGLRSDC